MLVRFLMMVEYTCLDRIDPMLVFINHFVAKFKAFDISLIKHTHWNTDMLNG